MVRKFYENGKKVVLAAKMGITKITTNILGFQLTSCRRHICV